MPAIIVEVAIRGEWSRQRHYPEKATISLRPGNEPARSLDRLGMHHPLPGICLGRQAIHRMDQPGAKGLLGIDDAR